ncbi:MAG: hypothetical protein E7212_11395 [Clostridium sartagoforme]|nr:hypothetical protein [Clostridium sartagoforme]
MQEYQKLNIKAIKSWRISRLIGTIITSIISIALVIFLSKVIDNFKEIRMIFIVAIALLIIFLLINAFIYPEIEYKQWSYSITNDKIEFSEGIYFVRRVIIPIIRIQHIQLNQGPINKLFDLYDISIFTAGGEHKIPNIESKKAEEISEYLKEAIKNKVKKEVDEIVDNSYENILLDKESGNYDESK